MPNMFENVDNNFAHVVCRRLKILVHFSLKLGNFTFSRNKVWKYPDLNLYLFRVFSRSVWSRFWHISDNRRSLCTMDPRIFVLVIKFYRNIEHLHFGISILNYLFFLFRLFLLGRFVFSICRDWDEDESEKALEQVEIECSYQFRHRIIKKENIFSLFKFDIRRKYRKPLHHHEDFSIHMIPFIF